VTVAAEDLFLAFEDGPAVWTENADGAGPVLLICEHAANRIPRSLGTLNLDHSVLQSHVAWDPGAYEVALRLTRSLDAALISARFSRLVYDVNRPPDSPQAIRAASEIYDIPGNQNLSARQRNARIEAIYRPFHETITGLIEARAAKGRTSVLVTIHSFTPVYYGKVRPVELGILHDRDARLADCLLDCAPRFTTRSVQRNQPYGPEDGVTHTLAKHALAHGLLNAMIEIRNDLIRTAAQQAELAEALSDMTGCALNALGVPTAKTPIDRSD
jgi:predicted N-formylglutamate amidohydrolase